MIRFVSFSILLSFCFSAFHANAQSSVYVRNSTWNGFQISVHQSGSFNIDPSDWSQTETMIEDWELDDLEVFNTNRDTGSIPPGDTALFFIQLKDGTDSLGLEFRVIGLAGTTSLEYSVTAPGNSDNWYSDGNYHDLLTQLGGRDVTIRYRPLNNDSGQSRDVLFVIHDLPIYTIDAAEFSNPNVLNVMAYNIQMLPFGVVGMPDADLRGDHFPGQISPYQDVVIYAEVFDDTPREDHLEPAMAAAGFIHKTVVLNETGQLLPWNGGVQIFSRWPIEFEDDYDFRLCGQAAQDCLANKGVKYARVNKLGKKYHVFGTHMDAGGGADDLEARMVQMGEIRDFIAVQNIPEDEAVVYGGDFNVAPDDPEYVNMLDSLNPVLPHAIGFQNSTMNVDSGHIIDHVWGCQKHLVPLSATNEVITPRSIHDDLWDLSEFSDHRCILGRFVYPDVASGTDTILCPGDDLTLNVTSSIAVTYQWFKDEQPIPGETTATYTILNADASDAGHYQCAVSYQQIFGNTGSNLDAYFYIYGPDTINASPKVEAGVVSVDCGTGINPGSYAVAGVQLYPNPSRGAVFIDLGEEEIENAHVDILAVNGELLATWALKAGTNEIRISDLADQLLFFKIKIDRGWVTRTVLKW